MLSRLKDLRVIFAILLVLTWIAVGVGGYFYYKSNQELLKSKDDEIYTLQTSLDSIEQMVDAFAVASDVEMGQEILDEHIVSIEVPVGIADSLIQYKEDLIGNYYKVDLSAGTPLTKDVVTTMEITDDMRLYDVVVHTVPIGLEPGSYVDVRISLPLGEDFIGMAHKKVYDINGNLLKLAVTEDDIHAYNSMLIDSIIYPGTQIYAVEYLQGAAQRPADSYYPVSANILAIAQRDPNLITAIKADMLQRRDSLESSLASVSKPETEDELARILDRGRAQYQASFSEASRIFERRMQEEAALRERMERDAARNAARQQQQNNN